MPITLSEPVARPSVTQAEIVSFNVDLQTGSVIIRFARKTADGVVIETTSSIATLFNANGIPQFTPAEYASIKGALYRIVIEQGLIAGAIT